MLLLLQHFALKIPTVRYRGREKERERETGEGERGEKSTIEYLLNIH